MYKLRYVLENHSSDVKCVKCFGENFLLSGGRDNVCLLMKLEKDKMPEILERFDVTSRYINSVCYYSACERYPNGAVLIGGLERKIFIRALNSDSGTSRIPDEVLSGHKDVISSIRVDVEGNILSSSWDFTVKIWSVNGQCLATLTEHTNGVWDVLPLKKPKSLLTASADNNIIMWVNWAKYKVFKGHRQPVRALTLLKKNRFLSASNDEEIRIWSFTDGSCLSVLSVHKNFIYTICSMYQNSNDTEDDNGDEFVSAGEERCIRVWKNQQVIEELPIPCQSIWSVEIMKNGDVVSAGSDGRIYVFTRHSELANNSECLKRYDELLKLSAISGNRLDPKLLPEKESALFLPGSHDGQTKIVRNGDATEVFEWKTDIAQWVKFGDVVDQSHESAGVNSKVRFEGQEYDYVFSVDVEGFPPLKLPFNRGSDYWEAAEKFILRHKINMVYLEQIVEFLKKNSSSDSSKTQDVQDSQPSKPIASSPLEPVVYSNLNLEGMLKRLLPVAHYEQSISQNMWIFQKTLPGIDTQSAASIDVTLSKLFIDPMKLHKATVNSHIIDSNFLVPLLDTIRFVGCASNRIEWLQKNVTYSEWIVSAWNKFFNPSEAFTHRYQLTMITIRIVCNAFTHTPLHNMLLQNGIECFIESISSDHLWQGDSSSIPNKNLQSSAAALHYNYSSLLYNRILKLSYADNNEESQILLFQNIPDLRLMYLRLLSCISHILENNSMFIDDSALNKLLSSAVTLIDGLLLTNLDETALFYINQLGPIEIQEMKELLKRLHDTLQEHLKIVSLETMSNEVTSIRRSLNEKTEMILSKIG